MDLIPRPDYLNFLQQFREKQLIKVISGVRRCGKSTLFTLFQRQLLKENVSPRQIVSINFEDLKFSALTDYRALHEYVLSHAVPDRMNYVFLDEIQQVPEFERAVDSLFLHSNLDIYMTGSNAWFMSGELATLLAGRYVELSMLPLSFREFCTGDANAAKRSPMANFNAYLQQGSFPYTLQFDGRQEDIDVYLDGIYSTIMLKDVAARYRINDVMRLESVFRYLMDNVGSLISIRKIADSLTSLGRKTDSKTIEKYVRGLKDSLIIYEVPRYNIRGKQLLSTLAKYYAVDLGMRNRKLGRRGGDTGHQLENVIYLELLRRHKTVYVGKMDETEVDFAAIGNEGPEYYQVALSTLDPAVLARELKPLQQIRDQYPKYLLTLDELEREASYNGIRKVNALDWLLGQNAE
ncbi:ATP-binding protein [uncultured Dialister sp.]|uniref:ATP-binding protein n=1 Tax=uncultured Dialister sp. TaxID=278064 RepID=UPI0025F3D683|nr:ATP-binding protein [uncultured Dialister sp.]